MAWTTPIQKTILVVDDNTALRRTLCDLLQGEGYSVMEAENGKTAEACLVNNAISLLITDIFMPEQDGLETIAKIYDKTPHVKIIAISGEGPCFSDTYLRTAEQLGALRSLPKPFKADDLLGLVNEVLTSN